MKNLEDIMLMPTVNDKVHESIFRSYHILEYVLIMVERGDSKDTIMEVVKLLKYPVAPQ